MIQLIGISYDELERMKDSRYGWIETRYPLVFEETTRLDCLRWYEAEGLPTPPKSACVACPYRSDESWRHLKINHPEEFAEAVEFDKAIRQGLKGVNKQNRVYLHRSCIPLGEIDFRNMEDLGQLSMFMDDSFRAECEGMCGI